MAHQGVHQLGPGISRRRLAAGLAWSMPAIGLVAAAPMVAASATCTNAVLEASGVFDARRFTLTNAGSSPIPAGAQITWTLLNTGSRSGELALHAAKGLDVVTNPSGTLRAGASAIGVLTVRSAIAAGGSASFDFSLRTSYAYQSSVTLTFDGTAAAECQSVSACASDTGRINGLGTTCPPPP